MLAGRISSTPLRSAYCRCTLQAKANAFWARPPPHRYKAVYVLRRALRGGKPPACQRLCHAACKRKSKQPGQSLATISSAICSAVMLLARRKASSTPAERKRAKQAGASTHPLTCAKRQKRCTAYAAKTPLRFVAWLSAVCKACRSEYAAASLQKQRANKPVRVRTRSFAKSRKKDSDSVAAGPPPRWIHPDILKHCRAGVPPPCTPPVGKEKRVWVSTNVIRHRHAIGAPTLAEKLG